MQLEARSHERLGRLIERRRSRRRSRARAGGAASIDHQTVRPALGRARRRSDRRCPPSPARSGPSARTASSARTSRPAPSRPPRCTSSAPSADPIRRSTSDTMKSIGRSARCRSSSAPIGPVAVIVTRAPSELPMTLSLRFSSSAALTVSRTSSSRSHVPSRRRIRPLRRPSGKSSRWTDADR